MGGRRSDINRTGNITLGLPESTLNFFESISKTKLNSIQKKEQVQNYKPATK